MRRAAVLFALIALTVTGVSLRIVRDQARRAAALSAAPTPR